ncbi:helix-turn-helix domain-containing protein [Kutzneria buriramensis]|uniref:Putative DNA-binding protein n=1 Tax=Kutzneria buriramensis TaxID=1045776 RepID=A0A3E0HU27_9PSEU|nr:ATP-binding protein [Kutzneria buriramensis]REH50052.1 putative DNA-binding protein [Kutzneria buriramensis]
MSVPETLDGWTVEVVEELVQIGQVESYRHDFKGMLPSPDELTKLCCAFVNTEGGFVVVGVHQQKGGQFDPRGIPPSTEIASEFGQKLKAVPTIPFEVPLPILLPNSSNLIYVFHVPRSLERPHLPLLADKRIFWKRTNTGNEQMSLEEIRAQFRNYEEMRDKLKLLFIELVQNREVLQEVAHVDLGTYSLQTLDNDVLDRLLVDVYSLIQDDVELTRALLLIRQQIRAANSKTQIFFRQLSIPSVSYDNLIVNHLKFMQAVEAVLLPAIEQAVYILKERYGLRDPFAEAE